MKIGARYDVKSFATDDERKNVCGMGLERTWVGLMLSTGVRTGRGLRYSALRDYRAIVQGYCSFHAFSASATEKLSGRTFAESLSYYYLALNHGD
jgi:hypothetical protein